MKRQIRIAVLVALVATACNAPAASILLRSRGW